MSAPGDRLDGARRLVNEARRVVALTGAGVSADSGVPTFRGPDGLWQGYDPQRLATPGAFARDPRLVWEWYGWRRERVAACRPNAAHRALARAALAGDVTLITQNVDGLHAVAAEEEAADPDRPAGPALPLELHGSLFRVRCTRCAVRYAHRGPVDARSDDTLPACRECGGLLRPDVVWFGEPLDERVVQSAFRAAEAADLCLVIGTSALVHPAAALPGATLRAGGAAIEVNPEPTPLSDRVQFALRGRAGDLVPALLDGRLGR